MLTEAQIALLRSLPLDGSNRDLTQEELGIALELHQAKLLFMIRSIWPCMAASITFAGRKALLTTSTTL